MMFFDLVSAFLAVFLGQAPALASPAKDLHFVIEREFTFLASTRSMRSEQWLGSDKSYEKRANSEIITRKDLGVVWVIDGSRKTYSERKLSPAKAESPLPSKTSGSPDQSKPTEDMRTAGFTYEPEYEWTLSDTGQSSTINGRTCTKVAASGDADYAETSLILWICPRSPDDPAGDPNPAMLDQIRGSSTRTFVESQLAKRGHPMLMVLEETTEPAISPVMITRVRITSLESNMPPNGQYDLPPGIQKAASPR